MHPNTAATIPFWGKPFWDELQEHWAGWSPWRDQRLHTWPNSRRSTVPPDSRMDTHTESRRSTFISHSGHAGHLSWWTDIKFLSTFRRAGAWTWLPCPSYTLSWLPKTAVIERPKFQTNISIHIQHCHFCLVKGSTARSISRIFPAYCANIIAEHARTKIRALSSRKVSWVFIWNEAWVRAKTSVQQNLAETPKRNVRICKADRLITETTCQKNLSNSC